MISFAIKRLQSPLFTLKDAGAVDWSAGRLDLRIEPAMRSKLPLKAISFLIALTLTLTGCVGASVSTLEPVPRSAPQNSSVETKREWCGVTLWAVVVPVPLKLPVCKLQNGQHLSDPLYACGPLMFWGPLLHGYEGNALCGVFPYW
ncbi:hypothetical protein ACIOWE_05990 [Pseudomonas sp. NPDC087598]|uniref:hypothetical protein n=1 Tax=Pseudomonas sp. NPDC087598 TaxID=3364440 RepID=UPI00381634D0